MTLQMRPSPQRTFVGTVIQQPTDQPAHPTYKDIAAANDHLHDVLNALLKERSGQQLTEAEGQLVAQHVVAKHWQLEHTNKERP